MAGTVVRQDLSATRAAAGAGSPGVVPRASGGVWLWSALGVAVVALMVNDWGRWLIDDRTHQPAAGPDRYDYLWALRGTEAVSVAVFVGLLWYSVINPLRTRRGLTFDGKLFIAGFFVSSLDILYASMNPTWAMNAHAVSLGTWAEYMPWFANPGQDRNAWGLLWCLPAYIWLGLGAALVGTAVLGQLRTRFPRLNTLACYGVTLVVFYMAFAVIENFWLRTRVYDYVSVPRELTLWAGQVYQFPAYSPLLIGFYCLGYTWLRDTRDAADRCAVDREVDRLTVPRPVKSALSLLAITGFSAATTVVGYQIPWSLLAMKGDSFPVLPSYLQPGQDCGQPGTPLCASQYLHQLRNDPAHLPIVR